MILKVSELDFTDIELFERISSVNVTKSAGNWRNLLKKSLTENLIFSAVMGVWLSLGVRWSNKQFIVLLVNCHITSVNMDNQKIQCIKKD